MQNKLFLLPLLLMVVTAPVFAGKVSELVSVTRVVDGKTEMISASKSKGKFMFKVVSLGKTLVNKKASEGDYIEFKQAVRGFKPAKKRKSKDPCLGRFRISIMENGKTRSQKGCFSYSNDNFNELYFDVNRIVYRQK